MAAKVKRMRCSDKEAVAAYRRVLKLVNSYLRKEKQELLVTDGRGLMTWGEIRYHISSAVALRHPMIEKDRAEGAGTRR